MGHARVYKIIPPLDFTKSENMTNHNNSTITMKFIHPTRNDIDLNVNIQNLNYTNNSGIAYGIGTGYIGVITRFSVIDNNGNTNFSDQPIQLELTLPMADTSKTLKLYKINTVTNQKIINIDYPISGRSVNYNAITGKWLTTLPSLSTFMIQAENNPVSSVGGDPHVQTIDGKHTLLPNDWRYVKLYEHYNTKVIVKCQHIQDELVENLHKFDENRKVILINKDLHKYVTDLTYMTELVVLQENKEVFKFDMLNDKVLLEEEKNIIQLEKVENDEGLFSLTNKRIYPKKNLSSYILHLDSNNILKLQVDNFWDDINFLQLHLFDKEHLEKYSGEFFKHSEENRLE